MPKKAVRVSAEVWRERVERWKQSGLSSQEFAAQEGITRPQTLAWWANEFKQRESGTGRGRRAPIVRLMKVSEMPSGSRGADVEIVLPSGARVAVGAQSDEQALVVALRALGART
jgi:transposase